MVSFSTLECLRAASRPGFCFAPPAPSSTQMIQANFPSAEPLCADFSLAEELFGEDFEVWAFDRQWHRVKTMGQRWEQLSVDFYVQLIERLSEAAKSSQVRFRGLDQRRTLCLLPLPDPHRHTVALAIVDRHSDRILELARRAASAAVVQQKYGYRVQQQLEESDSQLAAYTTRIARGREELSWLHTLAGNVVPSSADNNPQQIAARILPDMRHLMSARTVAFVPAPGNAATESEPVAIWQTGDDCVPEQICLSLIADHGDDALCGAAVCNYDLPVYRTSGFSGVLACIVQEVTCESGRVGWILAINKDLQQLASCDGVADVTHSLQRHCEFGPFESSLIGAAANALAAHARNCRLLEEKECLIDGAIRSLVNAIDAKDSYTCGHSDRVAEYARQIAATMQLSDEFCKRIYLTGLVHDVGKIGVPDSVLQKPGRLTDEEFDRIKQHPAIGHAILTHLEAFSYVLPGVLHHHEVVDGSGYPFGLKGDQIPLQARILAVADAYDAMTSDRPYRSGMTTEKAESIIAEGSGKQWDSNCVAAFQNCIEGIRRIAHSRHEPVVTKPSCRF